MSKETKDQKIERLQRQLDLIGDYVEQLVVEDIENDIRNAERCLREHGRTLEIENIAKNRMYQAGQNHVINEIRELIDKPRLYLPGEKERIDAQIKASNMGSREYYDCPPIDDNEFNFVDGKLKAVLIGEECETILVLGTSLYSAAMRACEPICDEYDMQLPTVDQMEKSKIVWRKADQEDGDFSHMFSWSEYNIKNNPNAIDGIIVRLT